MFFVVVNAINISDFKYFKFGEEWCERKKACLLPNVEMEKSNSVPDNASNSSIEFVGTIVPDVDDKDG